MKATYATRAVLLEGLRIRPAAVCDEIVTFVRREVNPWASAACCLG